MRFKVFLGGSITLILIQISVFGIYQVKSPFKEMKINDIVIVNKLAFGLHLPFLKASLIEWASPEVNDLIIMQTKNNKTHMKKVLKLENDVFVHKNKRFIVAKGSVFVGIDNQGTSYNMSTNGNYFGFLSKEMITGKCLFYSY